MPGRPCFLIVSGDIGQGHQAAARAVSEALESAWPGCRVEITETFTAMKGGSGPVLRGLYVVAVTLTPWLQQLWYAAVGRCEAVRWVYCRAIGGWAARALAPRAPPSTPTPWSPPIPWPPRGSAAAPYRCPRRPRHRDPQRCRPARVLGV